MRILVIEDDANLGEVFRDFLLELGHHPEVLRSAEAALARLRTERPEAILLDIQLPGMSGLDFLQLRPVRELGVPIIAVSGVVTEEQARECLRRGAFDFIGKPVALEHLSEVLTYLELNALNRGTGPGKPFTERRRSPRAGLAIPVSIVTYDGAERQGTAVELGVFGMKLRARAPLARGAVVTLSFTPPDRGAQLSLMAILVRVDPDGHVFTFLNLPAAEFQRLSQFVRQSPAP